VSGAVCATLASVPAGAGAQETEAPAAARTFLLRQPLPGLVTVPDGPELGDPGPVDLREAGWFTSTRAPDQAAELLEGLRFREGHFGVWVDPVSLQGVAILVESFDRRIDGPADEDVVTQRAVDELGPDAERIDTSAVPNSFGFTSPEDGVVVSFRRGQYSAQVVASPGLPNRRRVALDLASRQYGALPDDVAPAGSGGTTAEELGRFIASAGISLGALVMVCVVAVAIVRSFRRMASPPPDDSVPGGAWTPPPVGWPAAPTSAPPPAGPREPALAGPRRKGSTI
jgi:hypothetical protein